MCRTASRTGKKSHDNSDHQDWWRFTCERVIESSCPAAVSDHYFTGGQKYIDSVFIQTFFSSIQIPSLFTERS